jgi:hypothetical protein
MQALLDAPVALSASPAIDRLPAQHAADLFHVGQVLVCADDWALVDLPGRQTHARIAIPPPHALACGDWVVVVGRESQWYAVGIVATQHREAADRTLTFLATQDTVAFHAPHGCITLAAKEMSLSGQTVAIVSKTLRMTATSCLLQCLTVNQWVAGLVSQTVGRLYQGVTGDYHHHSQSIVERAEGQVTIKGDRIHLN